MVVSDLVRAVLMLGLAVVALAGLPVVLAPVLAGLATAAAAPYPPCAAATTPRLVPDADLPGANAARVGRRHGRRRRRPGRRRPSLLLLGPPSTAFLVNAGTFALSALAVLSIPAGPAFAPARAAGERREHRRRRRHRRPRPARRTPSPSAWSAPTSSAASSTACRPSCSCCSARQPRLRRGRLRLRAGRARRRRDPRHDASPAAPTAAPGRGPSSSGRCSSSPSRPRSWPSRRGCPACSLCSVIGGAGAVLVEVLCETALQRELDEEVFARAYGIALPVSIGGIVGRLAGGGPAGRAGRADRRDRRHRRAGRRLRRRSSPCPAAPSAGTGRRARSASSRRPPEPLAATAARITSSQSSYSSSVIGRAFRRACSRRSRGTSGRAVAPSQVPSIRRDELLPVPRGCAPPDDAVGARAGRRVDGALRGEEHRRRRGPRPIDAVRQHQQRDDGMVVVRDVAGPGGTRRRWSAAASPSRPSISVTHGWRWSRPR